MFKKSTTFCALLLLCALSSFTTFAEDEKSRMEAYIYREKLAHDFTPVTNFFKADETFAPDPSGVFNYVSAAQFFSIDVATRNYIMQAKPDGISLSIPKKDGGIYTIDLAKYYFLEADFKVKTVANIVETEYPYTPGVYYRGVIDGVPNSISAFSFFNDKIYGIFSIPGDGNYVLVPNKFSKDPATSYILYKDADLKELPKGECKTDDVLPNLTKQSLNRTTAFGDDKVINSCKTVKVYMHADYETYLSSSGNATDVTNYLTATFNYIATLYRNEAIYTTLTTVLVNTTADDYQTLPNRSIDFLNMFAGKTRNNMQGANIALLVSTMHSGGMGGVAFRGALCTTYYSQGGRYTGPYAFGNITGNARALPTYSWDVNMLTHELGHVIGSPHTHSCSWPGGAIDGCSDLEGNCSMPNPRYPTSGGTIMSYCHQRTGVGVNLANGFGPLPGNMIRKEVNDGSCMLVSTVSNILDAKNKVLSANRECTDPSGVTQYWNDNNTADQADDKLVLKIDKKGQDIGNLNNTGFVVRVVTTSGYGTGTAVNTTFPSGIQGLETNNVAMNRYWELKSTKTIFSNIEIMFPFGQKDIDDVDAVVPGAAAKASDFKMYTVINNGNPNPIANFPGVSANSINVYSSGTASTNTEWSHIATGIFHYARMLTKNTTIGGSAFISYTSPLSVSGMSKQAEELRVYPNPSSNGWTVLAPQNNDKPLTIQVYSVDGKLLMQQKLVNGSANRLNGTMLAAGMYFYRVVGESVYAGTLIKE